MDTLRNIERSADCTRVLETLKQRVTQAQYEALKAVNRELIALYWDIGRIIVEKQAQFGWGERIVERLAKDLQIEFEGVSGFSVRNLRYMKSFYLTYRDKPKLQPMVAEIGLTHNIIILDKCDADLEREFYLLTARRMGWSKHTLAEEEFFIDLLFYHRELRCLVAVEMKAVPESRSIIYVPVLTRSKGLDTLWA